jgi:hypothetical protein
VGLVQWMSIIVYFTALPCQCLCLGFRSNFMGHILGFNATVGTRARGMCTAVAGRGWGVGCVYRRCRQMKGGRIGNAWLLLFFCMRPTYRDLPFSIFLLMLQYQ